MRTRTRTTRIGIAHNKIRGVLEKVKPNQRQLTEVLLVLLNPHAESPVNQVQDQNRHRSRDTLTLPHRLDPTVAVTGVRVARLCSCGAGECMHTCVMLMAHGMCRGSRRPRLSSSSLYHSAIDAAMRPRSSCLRMWQCSTMFPG